MQKTMSKHMIIFSGSHHPKLAEDVAKKLGTKVSNSNLRYFANGEIKCQLGESVRGADVFIFQTHSPSVNNAIMEQAMMIDAAKRASARHITAICPLYGYARQDRKSQGREPITAKLVANIFRVAGVDRIVSMDLHTGQIQGFFDGPFDHLIAMPEIIAYLKKKYKRDCIIVSPDAGRVKAAERYAAKLGSDLAIVHKKRVNGSNAAEVSHLIGDVKGRNCVIVDDMIDGGGTMAAAASQLHDSGAKSIVIAATHGIFSAPAADRLAQAPIDEIIVTDTSPLPSEMAALSNVRVVSIAGVLANAVNAIFRNNTISGIFDDQNYS